MLSLFLSPPYLPFTIALVVMIGIGLIEAIGLGLGELDADVDHGFLDWLGVGEVPILIWLTSLLACFAIIGLVIQQVATLVTGAPLSPMVGGVAAGIAAFPLNTLAANGLARILPGFESTAVSSDELLRLRGTLLEGAAARGRPARAKVVDRHGQAHYLMIEPHEDGDVLRPGDTALLVRRQGNLYFAIPDAGSLRPL